MPSKTPASPAPQDRISLAKRRADIARVRELRALIAPLEGELKMLTDSIKADLERVGAREGFIGREVVATFATTTRQSLDQKALKTEQPEIAAKYTRTLPVRSFRITDAAS